MSLIRALLTAAALSIALTCFAASAAFAGAATPVAFAATPIAKTAHAPSAKRHHKHVRKSCRAPHKQKHNHKHHKNCQGLTRGLDKQHPNHTGSETGVGAHKGSSHTNTPSHVLHAKGAAHPHESTTINAQPAAATIASVLATPCQNTEVTPNQGNLEQVDAATLCLINQERARNGELPLRQNAQLAQAAQTHSIDMFEGDYFAHVAPNGETPFDRVKASGYIPNSQVGYTVGENIAWGTLYLATPSSIVAAWIASPEHLANILNSNYRDTAVAIVPAAPPSLAGGQAGAIYTQEFGVIEE